MSNSRTDIADGVTLYRGGTNVSSLLGAFGSSLRETRLTAMLGYLISLSPAEFSRAFGLKGTILFVSIEANHQRDRADIYLKTSRYNVVVEAKRDATDPSIQALKYPADKRVLITNYIPSMRQRSARGAKYINWKDIGIILNSLARSSSSRLKVASQDLRKYLEVHMMIRTRESTEIYAREINEDITLNLFLKGRIYGCNYQRNSRLPEALYFAPHFGNSIAQAHPGVKQGVSYIARIEAVEVVASWEQLLEVAKDHRGGQWLNKHRSYLEGIHKKWHWGKQRRSFLFLGEPRLIFNPPVKKDNLQKGKGFLSKRTFSFDQLFEAWNK